MPPVAVSQRPKFRVLLAKAGLDGHNRGAHVIVKGLIDAGFEVIYLGVRSTPEAIAHSALEEDVDCVGISILSGAHRTVLPRIRALLDERGMRPVPLIAGGIIPDPDVAWLQDHGVEDVFGPGSSLKDICRAIKSLCEQKRRRDSPAEAREGEARAEQ
jgi:methylmalonyl-CoA mutase C-terminal domain/subunit